MTSFRFSLLSLALVLPSLSASAATWDGGSTANPNWGSGDNWDDNLVPAFDTATDLIFHAPAAARLTSSINGDRTVRSLTFSAEVTAPVIIRPRQAGGATQVGRTLTFDADAGNALLTVDAAATANVSVLAQAVDAPGGGGALMLADTLEIAMNASTSTSAPTLTLGQNNDGVDAGSETVIQGPGGMVKSGVGILILAGPNTFEGGLTVQNGRAELNNSTAAGTGTVTLSGVAGGNSQVQVGSGLTVTNSLVVSDDGDIKQLRKFNTTSDSTWAGGITILENSPSNFRVQAGTGVTFTLSGVISGDGAAGLNKQSTGTAILTNENTYTGPTTVSAGTLSVTQAWFADASTINTGAILDLNHTATDTVTALFSGGVQQAAGLYKAPGAAGDGTELATLTGTGKLLVLTGSSFVGWMAGFTFAGGADLTPAGDADGDGWSNAVEHVFGTAPHAATAGIVVSSGGMPLAFTHPLNVSQAGNVSYSYEWSADLQEWKASGTANTAGVVATITADNSAGTSASVTAAITTGSSTRLFVRLTATVQ